MVNGNRIRETFRTREEAETRAEQIRIAKKNEGTAAFSLSPDQRAEASKCFADLHPYDVSLTEVVNHYIDHVLAYRNAPAISEIIQRMIADAETAKRRARTVQDLMWQKTAAEDRAVRQQAADALVKKRADALQKTTHWEDTRWELEPFGALAALWADTNYPDAAWLLSQAGERWYNLAEWTQAEPLLRRGMAIFEKSLGENHPYVATSLNNLAHYQRHVGIRDDHVISAHRSPTLPLGQPFEMRHEHGERDSTTTDPRLTPMWTWPSCGNLLRLAHPEVERDFSRIPCLSTSVARQPGEHQ